MFRKLAMLVMVLLFTLSLAGHAFAQGAASGESQQAFAAGKAPATPGTAIPNGTNGRLGYWELAGLGNGATASPVSASVYNPYCAFGPYGIYGQYSIYGPYGMYGPGGPGYGSGLGFNGFGMNDPWTLVKQRNEEKAEQPATGSVLL